MIKGVAFDLGDVVLEPISNDEANRFHVQLAEKGGRKLEVIEALVGALEDELYTGKINLDVFNIRVVGIAGIRPEEVGWLEECKRVERPDKEVVAIIKQLKQAYGVAYFSDIDPQDLQQLITRILEPELFTTGVASSELGEYKLDSRKGGELLLNRMGLKSSEVIYVDDSEKNINKAKLLFPDMPSVRFENPKQLVDALVLRGVRVGEGLQKSKSF